jgi:hypothetical protein
VIGGGNWTPANIGSRCETIGTAGSTDSTTITASGSTNTKGSWADIGTTGFAWKLLILCVDGNTGTACDGVLDLGINVGGNSFVIAEDLRISTTAPLTNEGQQYYWLPIAVPSGAVLSARLAASAASKTVKVTCTGFSNGLGGAAPFSRCRALYTSATSRGVAVDPGAASLTKGAYSQLVASTAFDVCAISFMFGYNGDISRGSFARWLIDLAIGGAGSEYIFLPNFVSHFETVIDGPFTSFIPPFPMFIPAGSRIAARALCASTTAGDRTFDIAAWGFEA